MTTITINAGTDGGVRWLVNDGATQLPYDFSGWAVRSQVRRAVTDSGVLFEWSTALGNATCDDSGYVSLFWTHAITSTWTWLDGVYDISLTSPAGKISRLDSGRVSVQREVTR